MASVRAFQIALGVSLLTHAAVLVGWPNLRWRKPPPEMQHELLLATGAASLPAPMSPTMLVQRAQELPTPVAGGRVRVVERTTPALQPGASFSASVDRSELPFLPAIVDLSNLSAELERHPLYRDYFYAIRERIRLAAHRNYPPHARQGKTFLSFTLAANGLLQQVSLDAARSSDDASLAQISLASVRDAAPFPRFPPAFDQPHLTFHISIEYYHELP